MYYNNVHICLPICKPYGLKFYVTPHILFLHWLQLQGKYSLQALQQQVPQQANTYVCAESKRRKNNIKPSAPNEKEETQGTSMGK